MAFANPPHPQQQSKLVSLPLEIRHRIYEFLNDHGLWEERQILRDYLDKIDPQSPRVTAWMQHFDVLDSSSERIRSNDELDLSGDRDDDDGGFDDEDVEEESDDGTDSEELNIDNDSISDSDHDSDNDETGDSEIGSEEAEDDGDVQMNDLTVSAEGGDDAIATESDATESESVGTETESETDSTDDEAEASDEQEDTTANARHVRPHNKFRHLPYWLYLSACPPSPSTLSICQRMYEEATEHYYESNSLHIETSKSFQHLTFFEETLDCIARAPFSPFEKLRKVHIRIAWDSNYINQVGPSVDPSSLDYDRLQILRGVFEDTLKLRIGYVTEALSKFAQLREVAVHLYDSKYGPEEIVLHDELLQELLMLCAKKNAECKIVKWEVIKGQRPSKGGVIGDLRTELKKFVAEGSEIC